MKTIFQYKDFDDVKSVKDVDVKKGIITGYFAAFGNVDKVGDMIIPGAFNKSILERGPEGKKSIYFLYQHQTDQLLGKPTVLKEDSYGLYFEAPIVQTTLGKDVLKLYEEGILDRHSIGYKTTVEQKKDDYNELKEIHLYEGSAVTFPANDAAVLVGVKGIDEDYLCKKIKKIEYFCKHTDASDETIEMLLLNIKQLSQIIIDLKNTTPPARSTEPDKSVTAETIKLFINTI